jgi:NAD(P)-dependent dehydrogenase (short-subunit alcohol dehydrogenase family)
MSEGQSPVTGDGKNAVVIGGTSGIGQSIARGFAEEGADVIATSRTESAVEETAQMPRERGATTAEVTCDVTEMDTLDELVETAEETLGGVDVLVNSGGAIARQRVDTVTDEEWDFVTDVQLDGVYRAIQAFSDALAAGDGGSVVNISSLASTVAMEDLAAYSAAKGGVDSLTRVAARELAPEVRVNAVAPGYVKTELTAGVRENESIREDLLSEIPHDRFADPEEVAGPVVYLASDAAGYVTGAVHAVDGGMTAG